MDKGGDWLAHVPHKVHKMTKLMILCGLQMITLNVQMNLGRKEVPHS